MKVYINKNNPLHCISSSAVEPFQKHYVSDNVLKRLLTKNVVRKISLEESINTNFQLYTAGKEASFFTLILEGCMEVQIGKDGLTFDSKAFTFFGAQALMESAVYIPDYTVRPRADSTVIIITKRQYSAAREATQFEGERAGASAEAGAVEQPKRDVFAKEWELAEDRDIQDSQSAGLSSITKFLCRRQKLTHQLSDQRHLLTQSSAESSDSQDLPSPQQNPTLAPQRSAGIMEDRYNWLSPTPPRDTPTSQSDGGGMREMARLDGIQNYESEPTVSQYRTSVGREGWTLNSSTEV